MNVLFIPPKDAVSIVRSKVRPVNVCLDIGCGINPQPIYARPAVAHHLTDPHLPYLEVARGARPNNVGWVEQATWAETVPLFAHVGLDTVFILDVIEHLEKEEGMALLEPTVALATSQVLVFTPYGFMSQPLLEGPDPWGMTTGGNELQVHRSGWLPEDFAFLEHDWVVVDAYVAEDYHTKGPRNSPLPEGPYGAMWIHIQK